VYDEKPDNERRGMVILKKILGNGHWSAPKAITVATKNDKKLHAQPEVS
jgi:hypothetical protein